MNVQWVHALTGTLDPSQPPELNAKIGSDGLWPSGRVLHYGERMLSMLEGPDLVVLLVVVLVLFGGSQLPKFARNLGQAQKEFKKGLKQVTDDAKPSE